MKLPTRTRDDSPQPVAGDLYERRAALVAAHDEKVAELERQKRDVMAELPILYDAYHAAGLKYHAAKDRELSAVFASSTERQNFEGTMQSTADPRLDELIAEAVRTEAALREKHHVVPSELWTTSTAPLKAVRARASRLQLEATSAADLDREIATMKNTIAQVTVNLARMVLRAA